MSTALQMDPRDPEAELLTALLPQVSRFLATHVDGYAIDHDGQIPLSVRTGLARLGLFGMTIPEAYGGAGLSLGAACRVVAELARVDRSVAIMVGLHAGLGTRGLVELGSPSLQARWLPRLASGECIAAFAATEAGAGSALTSITTTGSLVDGALRIDGEKSYVTNGGFAGLFTVLVRTKGLGGDRAQSLVCVPGDTPGVIRGAEEKKLGIRGSSTVTVTFDGVRVPLDHILGKPGDGMRQANSLLSWGRTLMSAGCVGAARGALDATRAHVLSRRQFGSPIGEFAATRAHVAWMWARTWAMDALVRSVGNAQSEGDGIEFESTLAKVFCSEGAFEVCDRAVQMHGALGFLEETGVPRILRDTRITRIFEGANDVLLLRIGAAALGDAALVRSGRRGRYCFEDSKIGQRIDDVARSVKRAIEEIRDRLGVGAVRHQLALQRIARAVLCVRAASASIEQSSDANRIVADYAADALVDAALVWVSRLAQADTDEIAARRVTDQFDAL